MADRELESPEIEIAEGKALPSSHFLYVIVLAVDFWSSARGRDPQCCEIFK